MRGLVWFIALRQQILLPCVAMHLLGLHRAPTKNTLLQSLIFLLCIRVLGSSLGLLNIVFK